MTRWSLILYMNHKEFIELLPVTKSDVVPDKLYEKISGIRKRQLDSISLIGIVFLLAVGIPLLIVFGWNSLFAIIPSLLIIIVIHFTGQHHFRKSINRHIACVIKSQYGSHFQVKYNNIIRDRWHITKNSVTSLGHNNKGDAYCSTIYLYKDPDTNKCQWVFVESAIPYEHEYFVQTITSDFAMYDDWQIERYNGYYRLTLESVKASEKDSFKFYVYLPERGFDIQKVSVDLMSVMEPRPTIE